MISLIWIPSLLLKMVVERYIRLRTALELFLKGMKMEIERYIRLQTTLELFLKGMTKGF